MENKSPIASTLIICGTVCIVAALACAAIMAALRIDMGPTNVAVPLAFGSALGGGAMVIIGIWKSRG